jgi:hypothetical protein
MRDRAFRRFQEIKKKEWVVKTFSFWRPLNESSIGQLACTPHNCSCYMCGNPRKHWKSKTLQEKRMDDFYKASEIME